MSETIRQHTFRAETDPILEPQMQLDCNMSSAEHSHVLRFSVAGLTS